MEPREQWFELSTGRDFGYVDTAAILKCALRSFGTPAGCAASTIFPCAFLAICCLGERSRRLVGNRAQRPFLPLGHVTRSPADREIRAEEFVDGSGGPNSQPKFYLAIPSETDEMSECRQ